MDKAQTLHAFWSSFGWAAYDETDVPDEAEFPYITYEVVEANIGKPVILNASLWDRSTVWRDISRKAKEIGDHLGYGGVTMRFDEGLLFLTQGTPFAQRLSGDDDAVRRIILNVAAEYYSAA